MFDVLCFVQTASAWLSVWKVTCAAQKMNAAIVFHF